MERLLLITLSNVALATAMAAILLPLGRLLRRPARRQTRVLTWPLLTVFGFIAQPKRHVFLKPKVTRAAAAAYGFPFRYESRPDYATYDSLLAFARTIRRDLRDLRPRDMIDLQSFMWVQGSDEYPD